MPSSLGGGLRLAAAGQLLLLSAVLLRDQRRSRVTGAAVVLAACVIGYLVLPIVPEAAAPALRLAASVCALAVPFAFWLAARVFFDDSFKPRAAHAAVLAALLGARWLVLRWPLAASIIGLAAVLDALRRVVAGAGSDLLVSRLRLRRAVLLGAGLYAVMVLAAEAAVGRGSPAAGGLNAANDMGLFVLVTAISTMVLRVEPDLVRVTAPRSALPDRPSLLARKLERLIEDEQVFKTEGLTIGALAGRLGEQEYKVRQLVNAHLGFRNFGAFLNHYRVREARKALADPEQKRLGVAEIAYRLGYGSLGPFNRAFKEIAGTTPTEYRTAALREEILADSEKGEASSKGG